MANLTSVSAQHKSEQIKHSSQELQLISRAQSGDEAAVADLIMMHTDFIYSRVRTHSGKRFFQDDQLDLFQEGAAAFVRAVQKFDPKKGVLLTTYAYEWVNQAIDRFVIKNAGHIKLPVDKYRKLATALAMKDRGYTNPEIAEEFGISEKVLVQILQAKAPIASLEAGVSSENDVSLSDMLAQSDESAEDTALNAEMSAHLYQWLDQLDSTEMAQTIAMRYGLNGQPDRTYEEIAQILTARSLEDGKDYKWNKEGVRQLERKAISKLYFLSERASRQHKESAGVSSLVSCGMFSQPVSPSLAVDSPDNQSFSPRA